MVVEDATRAYVIGIFVALEAEIPPVNSEVEFEFGPLSGSDSKLVGRGIVRWARESDGSHPRGIGLEFLQLDPGSNGRILQFLNAIKTKAFIPIK